MSTEKVVIRTYDRQVDLFNPYDEKNQVPIVVIGAGTIGSWTVLALAKLGLNKITVFDDDKVERQNIANQLYGPNDQSNDNLDKFKHYTLMVRVRDLTGIAINPVGYKFPNDPDFLPKVPFILIVTVDSMKSRKAIWEWIKVNPMRVLFYIDARTGGEVARVFALNPISMIPSENYEKTLHDDKPVEGMSAELKSASEVKCTARSIVDVSLMVASRITNSVRKYITNHDLPFETDFDCRNDIWLTSK